MKRVSCVSLQKVVYSATDMVGTVKEQSSRFAEILAGVDTQEIARVIATADEQRVMRVTAASAGAATAAPVLFSRAARQVLELLAQRARVVTLERFGRTVTLYAPLYLSNHCINHCRYCGFAAGRDIERLSLSVEEAESQAAILLEQGIRHILLVTGEHPARYGLDEICRVAERLRPRLASLSVEIFPCDLAGYRRLAAAGVDGVTLYQESYLPELYSRLHPAGPKRDFAARLAAIEAAGEAGLRSLGVGALLGMGPPMLEGALLALHAEWLQGRFPRARLAVSFPRLRPVAGGLEAEHPVSDAELVQLIVGMRLMLPDAELVVSTREPARLRDRLIPLGVTRLSAGSRTTPGAYGTNGDDTAAGQFSTDDRRPVAEVARAIHAAGYDVVTKDFDPAFLGPGRAP